MDKITEDHYLAPALQKLGWELRGRWRKYSYEDNLIALESDNEWLRDVQYCKDNYDGAPNAIPKDREFPTAKNN